MKMFLKLCKRDLKFKMILKVIKTKLYYVTHLSFGVYYWKLHASSAFS